MISFLTSLCELGFNGVTTRLPGDGYATFWALLKIFFIFIVPLSGVQLVVSKEVASYSVLGESGKRRTFVERTFLYTVAGALIIIGLGGVMSPVIKAFLRLESIFPVLLMFVVIGVYFPLPVLYGTIQGLKKFYTLGVMQVGWGFFRVVIGAAVVLLFYGGLNQFLAGIIAATIVTVIISWIPVRSVFTYPGKPIDKGEILHAYWLIVPVVVMLFCTTVMKNIDVVFAKRFFDSASADAYTCAALVGSAFYTLTGIFMVMFPMVSEENTRGRNPIVLLFKSCFFITSLSVVGIAVAWFAPELLNYIITVGKYKPGADPLIQLIGCAVLPLSLVFIISNYFLAKHHWRFIPILVAGVVLQFMFILFKHETPVEMLSGIITANYITLVGMIVYLVIEHRHFMKKFAD